MKLETTKVTQGDWIIVSGHDPADLKMHYIEVSNVRLPAMFERDRMMARCPKSLTGRVVVRVDGERLGVVAIEEG